MQGRKGGRARKEGECSVEQRNGKQRCAISNEEMKWRYVLCLCVCVSACLRMCLMCDAESRNEERGTRTMKRKKECEELAGRRDKKQKKAAEAQTKMIVQKSRGTWQSVLCVVGGWVCGPLQAQVLAKHNAISPHVPTGWTEDSYHEKKDSCLPSSRSFFYSTSSTLSYCSWSLNWMRNVKDNVAHT